MIGPVAITGVGAVSALGKDAPSTFARLCAGESAFRDVSVFEARDQRCCLVAEVPERYLEQSVDLPSRTLALALPAAREAAAQAGARPVDGLVFGTTTSGMLESEVELARLSGEAQTAEPAPSLIEYPLSTVARHLAEHLGLPSWATTTLCSACSSGATAIAHAAHLVLTGKARRVLAGGADALCRLTLSGFNALGAVDSRPCRPFDSERAGLNLGEAGAFLVLEAAASVQSSGQPVLAWLIGWALGAEAHHITHPDPSGKPAAALIEHALSRAGLAPEQIDYVNAHGTATPQNDAMEARALRDVFGDHAANLYVSSCKGQLGHTLGAAGALEAVITVLALARDQIPPTLGLSRVDPEAPFRHVLRRGQPARIQRALCSSFGFGGAQAVLAFEREPRSEVGQSGARARLPHPRHAQQTAPLVITAAVSAGRAGLLVNEDNRVLVDPPANAAFDARAAIDPERGRRFDDTTACAAVSTERALEAARRPERCGLVLGNSYACTGRTARFLARIEQRGARNAAPAEFPFIVPSALSGATSVYAGLRGPVFNVAALDAASDLAIGAALDWLALDASGVLLAGAVEGVEPLVEGDTKQRLGARSSDVSVPSAAWLMLESSESARRRNAVVLAEVRKFEICADDSVAPRLPNLAGPAGKSVVLSCSADLPLPGGWSSETRRTLGADITQPSVWLALAACLAVAWLVEQRADSVLVVHAAEGRRTFLHLASPAARSND